MKFKKILICFVIIYFIFQSNFLSMATENTEDLNLYSESGILIDAKTGKILYEKNIHERKYPASTTKMLTAIIAIENCNLNDTATASYNAVNSIEKGYTKADIQVGETFTIEQLLNVLMLQSANEAANIIAEHISGSVSKFAKVMNQKAKEIGCVDSNFVNANGVHDENHYSSAYDLALIAKYSMQNDTFRRIVTQKECSLPHTEFWTDEQVAEHGERNFKNSNNLLMPESKYYYPYAISIKAGFTTPAKNCLVTGCNRDGFEMISVVLHAENTEDGSSARYVDTINLFEYGYNNFVKNQVIQEDDKEESMLKDETLEKEVQVVNATTDNTNDNFQNMVKIIIGGGIFLIILIIYIFKKTRKLKKTKRLYYFNFND